MMRILVIQNARLEGPGMLGNLFQSDGFALDVVFAKKEKIPQLGHSAVLVLGAPESANDELSYLKEEMDLIRRAVQENIPVLGVCLGSQLIAKAFGGRVYPGPKKEIGFYSDVLVDASSGDRLFDGIQSPFSVFHWHGDTFDIPDGAKRLAYSDMYTQAFRYKSAVAVQFHLEVDGDMVNSWLDNAPEAAALPYIDSEKIRLDVKSEMPKVQKNMEIFYKNFRSEFALTKV